MSARLGMTKILFLRAPAPRRFLEAGRRAAAGRLAEGVFRLARSRRSAARPAIKGIDDLVRMVTAKMDGPVDLVAQSMGGVHRRAAGDRATAQCAPAGA